MGINIKGIGILGGFGAGMDCLEKALGRRYHQPEPVRLDTSGGTVKLPAYIADTSPLSNSFAPRKLRRVDHFSRMGLLAAGLALEDASAMDQDHRDLGMVLATGYGAMGSTYALKDSIMANGDPAASPTKFSSSVHNSAASHISMFFNIRGPIYTVSQLSVSVPSAILIACQWLLEERVEQVLVGGIDEFCDVLGYCHLRMFGSRRDDPVNPLQFDADTPIPGEGAVFFLLSRAEREVAGYGRIINAWSGRMEHGEIDIPDKVILIPGAEGYRVCGEGYRRWIPKKSDLACYTPLYGSLPIGTAFDMAIAALGMKSDRVFPSPDAVTSHPDYRVIQKEQGLNSRTMLCLKVGSRNEIGWVTLAPNRT